MKTNQAGYLAPKLMDCLKT